MIFRQYVSTTPVLMLPRSVETSRRDGIDNRNKEEEIHEQRHFS